jgi:D-alanyl-D-alanine carboxypeptidase (penicillin-binding protein 5/6)
MTGSSFANAEGLPDDSLYTTARDMGRLTAALIQRFPEMYRWHAQREFTFNEITQRNRNRLLWLDESVDGVKTGYTRSAGYCLAASAEREGMRLVSIVLGSKTPRTRVSETQTLLNFGFRFFETRRLFAAGETVSSARVWEGSRRSLGLGLDRDLYITVPRGQYKDLATDVVVNGRILAPVHRGQRYVALKVSLGESAVAERELVALQEVEEGSLWQVWSDRVRLWFE